MVLTKRFKIIKIKRLISLLKGKLIFKGIAVFLSKKYAEHNAMIN